MSRKCEVKGRVCEVSLGRSSYGEGGRRMRSCHPTTSQITWVITPCYESGDLYSGYKSKVKQFMNPVNSGFKSTVW